MNVLKTLPPQSTKFEWKYNTTQLLDPPPLQLVKGCLYGKQDWIKSKAVQYTGW